VHIFCIFKILKKELSMIVIGLAFFGGGAEVLEVAVGGFELALLLQHFLYFEIVDEVLAALDLGILDLADLRLIIITLSLKNLAHFLPWYS